MKDKKNYYVLGAVLFIVCYITTTLIACREVQLFGIVASASILTYPLTYLLLTIFYEQYGNKKTISLINTAVIAVVFSALLVNIASLLPVSGGKDGLEALFNFNFRITVASIAGFYLSQNLHLMLYDYLEYNKTLKFLLSGTIAVTADGIIFVVLSNVGKLDFAGMAKLFTGQYVFNVISMFLYAFIFALIISKIKPIKKETTKDKNKRSKEKTKKTTTKKASK